jgi:hypothetical protein
VKLKPREEKAVVAALAHRDAQDAARALGIQPRSFRKILIRPHVRAALQAAMRDALRDSVAELARGVVAAARYLNDTVTGAVPTSATRVAAARAVLSDANALIAQDEIEARLEQLEARRRSEDAARIGARGLQ